MQYNMQFPSFSKCLQSMFTSAALTSLGVEYLAARKTNSYLLSFSKQNMGEL